MKYGLVLTNRDISIISYLKEQGVATSEQLTKLFFKSYGSFRYRMSFLIRSGLIESIPLSSGVNSVPSKMLELKSILRDQGKCWQNIKLYRMSKKLSGNYEKHESPLGEPIFWQHQLGLNEIRTHLSGIFTGGIFISDPESKAEWARFRFGSDIPIPDLVWRNEKIEYAIEYERTNKGEMRYFERMAKYQRSHYERVLFVANTDDIADLLKKCSFRFPKIGITSRSSLDKVYVGINGFMKFSDFLRGVHFNETRVRS